MERRWLRLAAVGGATLALALGAQVVSAQHAPKLLEFDSMVGVPSALTGTKAATTFRGINAGGLPWMLSSGRGELSASGHLEIKVTGLVLAGGANAGSNPISSFRGLVSCIRSDGSVNNVLTDPFPATIGPASSGGGDSEIEADVALPSPCLAPIVFVTSPGGAWFAVTGG